MEKISKFPAFRFNGLKMPNSNKEAESRLEINNLINIYCACSLADKEKVIERYSSKEISLFKNDLADIVISTVEPISKKAKKFLSDKKYLNEVLTTGAIRARQISQKTISDLYGIIGIIDKS